MNDLDFNPSEVIVTIRYKDGRKEDVKSGIEFYSNHRRRYRYSRVPVPIELSLKIHDTYYKEKDIESISIDYRDGGWGCVEIHFSY